MKEYDDQIRIDKFNPFFEDDEVINPLDDGFFNNPFDTIQTIPDFDLINMVIQDPYIDGFIPPSTDPFTELGCDKTGVLGKIGYDDEIKKTDEREGDLIDEVTNNPILVVQAGETAEFTLIENNQSPDKYNWIVKESGTVNPRMGQRVTLTAPDSVPDGDEAIKLYLFNEQHQLDYVKIEIEPTAPKLFVSISKEGYDSYGFVWNIVDGIIDTAIGKDVSAKGKVVGEELFLIEENSRTAVHIDCEPFFPSGCSNTISETATCPDIDGYALINTWSVDRWWVGYIVESEYELTVQNYNTLFNSYKLTALNDSDYIGAAHTTINAKSNEVYYGHDYYTKFMVKTPIGDLFSFETTSSGYFEKGVHNGSVAGQYSDNCISQGYILQYDDDDDSYTIDRKVKVFAQASIVSDGNTQTPRGLERTTALETAVEALVNAWYAGNGFGSTDIETLTVTWELR